jgi:DNA-binding transcriptional ArsR family regulator
VTAVAPRLDAIIHPPLRLQVCGLLPAVDTMDLPAVRDAVGVSDSVLSEHVKQLEEAGYVRGAQGRHPRLAAAHQPRAHRRRAGSVRRYVAERRRITGG